METKEMHPKKEEILEKQCFSNKSLIGNIVVFTTEKKDEKIRGYTWRILVSLYHLS